MPPPKKRKAIEDTAQALDSDDHDYNDDARPDNTWKSAVDKNLKEQQTLHDAGMWIVHKDTAPASYDDYDVAQAESRIVQEYGIKALLGADVQHYQGESLRLLNLATKIVDVKDTYIDLLEKKVDELWDSQVAALSDYVAEMSVQRIMECFGPAKFQEFLTLNARSRDAQRDSLKADNEERQHMVDTQFALTSEAVAQNIRLLEWLQKEAAEVAARRDNLQIEIDTLSVTVNNLNLKVNNMTNVQIINNHTTINQNGSAVVGEWKGTIPPPPTYGMMCRQMKKCGIPDCHFTHPRQLKYYGNAYINDLEYAPA